MTAPGSRPPGGPGDRGDEPGGPVRGPRGGGEAPLNGSAGPQNGLPGDIEVDVSSVRLVGTLGVAGALAGLVIVLVFQWAQPRIEAHQVRVLREAIVEVLGGPESYETAFLTESGFTTEPSASADTASLDRIYVGFDANGRRTGVAVVGSEAGFQDQIRLIFGFDPVSSELLGMKVLESKETPGLGDKIEKDMVFVAEFSGVETPLAGVKPGRERGDPGEVVMITGATISSRAVIDIINNRLGGIRAPIEAFWTGGEGLS